MPIVHASFYQPSAAGDWDDLVAAASMGTFLHTRQFLAYHEERFEDTSVVIHDSKGRVRGVLPAAVDPGDRTRVTSHPGATFGGIVHDGSLVGGAMIEALAAVCDHYREREFERLAYAPVPFIYHRQPSADDLYALSRLGGVRARCKLSCAIDLASDARRSSRRRRGLAKALRAGVEVVEGRELIGELWPIVEKSLAARHRARPVHSERELCQLATWFPDAIDVVLARRGSQAIAGVVLFENPRVSHAQYIASSDSGYAVGALDAVFDRCLSRAAARGARYFDFGTSNRDQGRVLNDGLYQFKAQFGGGGVAYELYELELSSTPSTS